MTARMVTRAQLLNLRGSLSGQDFAILSTVADARLMTGDQVQRSFFPSEAHATHAAAARACRRTLERLTWQRLLVRLQRRVGGVRRGSSSYVYTLGAVGYRLLERGGRAGAYSEPSLYYLNHSLGVNEVVIAAQTAARRGEVELARLEREPACWRRFGGHHELHPDLFVGIDTDELEIRWFVEVDMGTETIPHLLKKCRVYDAYYKTGEEQEKLGLFPGVLWLMHDAARVERLRDAIQHTKGLNPEMFVVGTADQVLDLLKGGEP